MEGNDVIYYIRFEEIYKPVPQRSYSLLDDYLNVFNLIRFNNPLRYDYYYNHEWHELS